MHKTKSSQKCAREKQQRMAQLREVFTDLQKNDRQYQLATEPFVVEQLIYERAALLSRCRALLHTLRGAETEQPQ